MSNWAKSLGGIFRPAPREEATDGDTQVDEPLRPDRHAPAANKANIWARVLLPVDTQTEREDQQEEGSSPQGADHSEAPDGDDSRSEAASEEHEHTGDGPEDGPYSADEDGSEGHEDPQPLQEAAEPEQARSSPARGPTTPRPLQRPQRNQPQRGVAEQADDSDSDDLLESLADKIARSQQESRARGSTASKASKPRGYDEEEEEEKEGKSQGARRLDEEQEDEEDEEGEEESKKLSSEGSGSDEGEEEEQEEEVAMVDMTSEAEEANGYDRERGAGERDSMDTVAPMEVQEDGASADDESSDSSEDEDEEEEEEEEEEAKQPVGRGKAGKAPASKKVEKSESKPSTGIKYRGVTYHGVHGYRATMRGIGAVRRSEYFDDPADAARAHDDYFRDRYTHPVLNFLDDGRLNPHRNDGARHEGKIDRASSQGSEDADRDEVAGGCSQASDGPRWAARTRRARTVINMADPDSDVEDLFTQANMSMRIGEKEEEDSEEEEDEEKGGKAGRGKGARREGPARAGKRKGQDKERDTGGEEKSPAKKGRRGKEVEEDEEMDSDQGGPLMDFDDGPIEVDEEPVRQLRPKRGCVKAEKQPIKPAAAKPVATRRKAGKATCSQAQGGGGGGAARKGDTSDTKTEKQAERRGDKQHCSVEEAISSLKPLAYNGMHDAKDKARYSQLAKLLAQPTDAFRDSVRDYLCHPDSVFDLNDLEKRTTGLDLLLNIHTTK